MDDLVGAGKIAESLEKATSEFRKLAAQFLGPAAGEAGELFRDQLRYWRLQNQIRLFKNAKKLLDEHGIKPGQVDNRTLLPLVEGAGAEDDEGLSSKWAGLLASAAAGDEIPPSYPKILAQLGPAEARILDYFYDYVDKYHHNDSPVPPFYRPELEKLKEQLSVSERNYKFHFETLARLGLVESGVVGDPLKPIREALGFLGDEPSVSLERIRQEIKWLPSKRDDDWSAVEYTALGIDFVRTCRGPRGQNGKS